MNQTLTENGIERKSSVSDPFKNQQMSDQHNDKPKLERSKSVSGKENVINRTGSLLRRQYSENDETALRMMPNDQFYAQNTTNNNYNDQDSTFYKNEIEDLIRSHPHLVPHIRPVPATDFQNHSSTEPKQPQQYNQNQQKSVRSNQQDSHISLTQSQSQPQPQPQPVAPQLNLANSRKHKRSNSLKKHVERQQLSFSSSEDDELNNSRTKQNVSRECF